MSDLPVCPKCNSEYVYEDGNLYICPECAHEWGKDAAVGNADDERVVNDANGNRLSDGDTVSVIKDLKVKGSSSVVKVGTKVKNIRGNVRRGLLINTLRSTRKDDGSRTFRFYF